MPMLRDTGRTGRPLAVPVVIALVLQLALAPQISILGGRFNFLMALALALAPGFTPGSAAVLGFACGLAFDLTSAVPVGLMALILTVACFALSTSTMGMPLGFTRDGIRLTGIAITAAQLVYGIALIIMGVEGSIVSALIGHGLASAVLTVLASLPFLALAPQGDAGRGFTAKSRTGTRYKTLR